MTPAEFRDFLQRVLSKELDNAPEEFAELLQIAVEAANEGNKKQDTPSTQSSEQEQPKSQAAFYDL